MAEDKKKEIDVTVIEVTEEYLKEKLYKIRGKRIFSLDRKADVDIYHTYLQSKEFICLQQFFVENWRNNRVYLLCVLLGRCVTILGRISSLLPEMKWIF